MTASTDLFAAARARGVELQLGTWGAFVSFKGDAFRIVLDRQRPIVRTYHDGRLVRDQAHPSAGAAVSDVKTQLAVALEAFGVWVD